MSHKSDRAAHEIMKEISEIIRELKDPRLGNGLISVTRVEVTSDLGYAKVFVSSFGDDGAAAVLQSAAGFIRKEIGHRLKIRHSPALTFYADNSIEYGAHINEVLKKIERDEGWNEDN